MPFGQKSPFKWEVTVIAFELYIFILKQIKANFTVVHQEKCQTVRSGTCRQWDRMWQKFIVHSRLFWKEVLWCLRVSFKVLRNNDALKFLLLLITLLDQTICGGERYVHFSVNCFYNKWPVTWGARWLDVPPQIIATQAMRESRFVRVSPVQLCTVPRVTANGLLAEQILLKSAFFPTGHPATKR